MLDDALVQCERFGKYENCAVSILVVLDDALVLSLITLWCDVQLTISILVVLDDALVPWNSS